MSSAVSESETAAVCAPTAASAQEVAAPPVFSPGQDNTAVGAAPSSVFAFPTALAIINWAEAMVQVGDDREFLDEVLQDLVDEAEQSVQEIQTAIDTGNFDAVSKASHRIKGSTAYLFCEVMNNLAYQMEVLALGQQPSRSTAKPVEEAWTTLRSLFADFQVSFANLKQEIEREKSSSE